jgi:hypothetical protein
VLVSLLLPIAFALPAQAAVPANDDRANAIALSGALPITVEGDSSEATPQDLTDPIDDCTGVRYQHTVWYEYTPTDTGRVAFDITSNFGAGAVFFRVTDNGGLEHYGCAGNATYIDFTGGETYLVMVGTCCSGPLFGGTFTFSLTTAAPPLDIQVTVDSASYDRRTGTTYLTGTHTCNITTDYFDLVFTISQENKKTKELVWDTFNEPNAGPCTTTTTKWTASVVGQIYSLTSLLVEAQAIGYAQENETGDDTIIIKTLPLTRHK